MRMPSMSWPSPLRLQETASQRCAQPYCNHSLVYRLLDCDLWLALAYRATLLLLQINHYVYVDKKIDTSAFTYFSQIRVLNEESAYISTTNGEHTQRH